MQVHFSDYESEQTKERQQQQNDAMDDLCSEEYRFIRVGFLTLFYLLSIGLILGGVVLLSTESEYVKTTCTVLAIDPVPCETECSEGCVQHCTLCQGNSAGLTLSAEECTDSSSGNNRTFYYNAY